MVLGVHWSIVEEKKEEEEEEEEEVDWHAAREVLPAGLLPEGQLVQLVEEEKDE